MNEMVRYSRDPWSVFDELAGIQDEFNRALAGLSIDGGRSRKRVGLPPMNVWASDEGLIVDVELPGVDPADIDIHAVGDELTVKGNLNGGSEKQAHRCERPHGRFERTLQLPFRANQEKVAAHYRNGILRITVPRSEVEKPRKVAIEAA